MIVRKSLLKEDPEQAREQAEIIAHAFALPYEHEAGKQLRALAVELVKQEALGVAFVTYEDGAQELEVFFSSNPARGTITVTRNKCGDQCQVTWEQWAGINSDTEIRKVASMVAAVLTSCANANSDGGRNLSQNIGAERGRS